MFFLFFSSFFDFIGCSSDYFVFVMFFVFYVFLVFIILFFKQFLFWLFVVCFVFLNLCFVFYVFKFVVQTFSFFEYVNCCFFLEFVPFFPVFFGGGICFGMRGLIFAVVFWYVFEFLRIFQNLFASIATFRSNPLRSIPGLFNDNPSKNNKVKRTFSWCAIPASSSRCLRPSTVAWQGFRFFSAGWLVKI